MVELILFVRDRVSNVLLPGVVFSDGLITGTTDSSGKIVGTVDEGPNFSVTLTKKGYETRRVNLARNRDRTTNLTLPPIEKPVVEPEPPPEPVPELGEVRGRIIGEDGQPIPGVNVSVNGSRTQTDSRGEYRFTEIPGGMRTIRASKTGYVTKERTQRTVAGQSLRQDFTLIKIVVEVPPEVPPEKPDFLKGFINGLTAFLNDIFTDPHVTAYRKFWDDLAKDWGVEIPPGSGNFKILFVPAAGVASVATKAGLSATAKTALQTTVSDHTIANLVKNPELTRNVLIKMTTKEAEEFVRLIDRIPSSTKEKLIGQLFKIDPQGRSISVITNARGRLEKPIQLIWGKVPTEAKMLFGLGAFLVSIKLWTTWAVIDNLGFYVTGGIDNLIFAKEYEEAQNAIDSARATLTGFVEAVEKDVVVDVLTQGAWPAIATSMLTKLDISQILLNAKKDPDKPPTTFSVETDKDPAGVEIIGIPINFLTPFTTDILPGNYDLVAEKEGFEPETRSFFIEENVPKTMTIAFDRPLKDVDPTKAELQVTIRDAKTNAAVKATLFINNTAEKFHLSTHVVTLEPGNYEIRIEEPGFEKAQDTVNVKKGERTKINIELTKLEIIEDPFIGVTCESLGFHTEKPIDGKEYVQVFERGMTCWALKKMDKGRLELTSEPEAQVFIAGKLVVSKTPDTIELQQGFYNVVFKAEGFNDLRRSAVIKAGELSRLAVSLIGIDEPQPTRLLPKIIVNSNPTGAKILINGEWTKKYTPDSVLLLPGEYELSLTKSGFEQWFYALNLVEE